MTPEAGADERRAAAGQPAAAAGHPAPDGEDLGAQRELVADACRILAMEGLVEGTLGHVSVRVDDRRMLVRARGPAERGLAFTTADDVRLVDLDGRSDEPTDGYSVPNELPIHGELFRARPGVGAVVHAHPRAVLLCGIAGLELRPIFGAFNIPAMRLALDGVPVYPRSVLIRRPELAAEMIAAMGDRPVCVLRGHGITVTGETVQQAVVRAVDLNTLATVVAGVAQLGATAPDVAERDVAELPDLGSAFNDEMVWRYLRTKLARTEHLA